jgi:antibiotic biosynthesis monooxygenase (ABM) superfamily enzyme
LTSPTDATAVRAIVTRVLLTEAGPGGVGSWQAAMTRLISAQPGFLSVEFLPIHAGSAEWQVIERFATAEALGRWLADPRRAGLLAVLEPLRVPGGLRQVEQAAPDYHAAATVTEVITTVVQPGRRDDFLAWAESAQAAQARFAGYMGTLVQAPVGEGPPAWTTLVRFATPEHLDAWLNSAERHAFIDRADPTMSRWSSRRVAAGFGNWFPADASGRQAPGWKQTALVLLVLFPIVMLEMRFLSPHLASLPLAVATFIGNAISVALVSWPLVGFAQRAMRWWLYPPAVQRWRNEVGGAVLLMALYAAEMGVLSLLF